MTLVHPTRLHSVDQNSEECCRHLTLQSFVSTICLDCEVSVTHDELTGLAVYDRDD